MLSEVEVRNAQGSSMTLSLEDISDGIILADIDGLDPVKATIVTSSFANQDGTQYHTSSREDRNIKFQLLMEPEDVSVAEVRQRLYGFFMPKSPVSFTFKDDEGLEVDISGRVESFEAPLFTADPEANISVICFDSDFVDMNSVVVNAETVSDTSTIDINYLGTVETGIQLDLYPDRPITEFTMYSTSADGILRTMDFAAPMAAGNVLTIITIPGQKSAMLSVLGTPSSILYGVSPHANWLELQPGVNSLRIYAEGAPIPYSITYFTRYGGL
jgi:hypothetical protein